MGSADGITGMNGERAPTMAGSYKGKPLVCFEVCQPWMAFRTSIKAWFFYKLECALKFFGGDVGSGRSAGIFQLNVALQQKLACFRY
jgi:hypothetical protein